MFERFCAALLRLYPPGFRETYGRDALQLMRDRARDERGFFPRLRLTLDLLRDLLVLSLKGWSGSAPVAVAAVAPYRGTPSFHLIETTGPKPQSLVAGMLASTMMFAGFSLLFQAREFADGAALISEGPGSEPFPADPSDDADETRIVAADTRAWLIATVAGHVKEHYFDPQTGWRLATTLLGHQADGQYESAVTWPELVGRLNRDLRNAARTFGIPDGHFVADVVYSEQPLPSGPPAAPTAEMRAQRRQLLLKRNCLFERIETLANNVGYLKLNGFPDPSICGETANRVMAAMNNVDVLIVDLRQNGGGMGELALQIAGHFFDGPRFFYDPREASRVPKYTASPIEGNKLFDKPLYLLTSPRTQSAAEYFVYNLKMLKRATIVGETTAGAQHSGRFYQLNDHFGIGIQATPPPDNPFPIKGWEGIGVEPDVKITNGDALDAARNLAVTATRR